MELKGKTVLLTGASGGIGRSMALSLAQSGARLVLVGRNLDALAQLGRSLPRQTQRLIVNADISVAEGRSQVIRTAERLSNGIDIVVNNAGINDFAFLEEQSDEIIEQMIQTNLLSPILLCRGLLPILRRKKIAMIVNVGSSLGSIGFPGYAAYCASKFGLRGFTESLRRELADTGIRAMYIAP